MLIRISIFLFVFLSCSATATSQSKLPAGGLIFIDTVSLSPDSTTLIIVGNLPDGCTSIIETGVSIEDNILKVVILTERPEEIMCTQALEPFEIEILLEEFSIKPGEYHIMINDEIMDMTISLRSDLSTEQMFSSRALFLLVSYCVLSILPALNWILGMI